ncbi:hypothetical protein CGRA01v4_03163 [Colletotrichum graminicola]|nr:hypothetical protein CGRA01v4_03163 [Colletotrichum graminicola]
MGLPMPVACCWARRVRPIPSQSPPVARTGEHRANADRPSGYKESLFSLSRIADDAMPVPGGTKGTSGLRRQRSGDAVTMSPRDFAMGW